MQNHCKGPLRKLQQHSDRLFLDALVMLVGARPAFLLDYAVAASAEIKRLAADLQRASGVNCTVLSWGSSCHLIGNIQALIGHLQGFSLQEGPGEHSSGTACAQDDKSSITALLIGFCSEARGGRSNGTADDSQLAPSVFPRILECQQGCSPIYHALAPLLQALHEWQAQHPPIPAELKIDTAGGTLVGFSLAGPVTHRVPLHEREGATPVTYRAPLHEREGAAPVLHIDLERLPGLPLMPTLNGLLLGYPVVYAVATAEESQKAARCLSSGSITVFRACAEASKWESLLTALRRQNSSGGRTQTLGNSGSRGREHDNLCISAFSVPTCLLQGPEDHSVTPLNDLVGDCVGRWEARLKLALKYQAGLTEVVCSREDKGLQAISL